MSITWRPASWLGLDRGPGDRGKVDYREVLKPEEFAAVREAAGVAASDRQGRGSAGLRDLHQRATGADGRQEARSKADLDKIDGVGEARIQKYGERFLGVPEAAPGWDR